MNKVFEPRGYFTVCDGTEVSPFLNASDVMQDDVPWGLLKEMSVASGRIRPGVHSWVHIHPAVTQVTYVTSGALTIRMKERGAADPYDLDVSAGQAVVSEPGTLFQLRNDREDAAEVLYIVSPSYAFEGEEGKVPRHDDAIMVAKTWEELASANYEADALNKTDYEAHAERAECMRRLAGRKGHAPSPIAKEDIVSLKSAYDYLAPDGSEMRLLVAGEHGSFAHCVLPAGETSAPVRHRTVEELWYVLEGAGEIWRGRDGEPSLVDAIRVGDSVRIPVGTAFQFRAHTTLKLLLATMPPWPGAPAREAVPASGGFDSAAGGRPT